MEMLNQLARCFRRSQDDNLRNRKDSNAITSQQTRAYSMNYDEEAYKIFESRKNYPDSGIAERDLDCIWWVPKMVAENS